MSDVTERQWDDSFCRLQMLIGEPGARKLRLARVLVVGLGGVGSWAAEALARCGLGQLTLVDHDVVQASNINRQLPALRSTIGTAKVAVMRDRLQDIAPQTVFECQQQRLTEDNCEDIISRQPPWDCVIDAIDDRHAKIALILACEKNGVPLISSMGSGDKLDASAVQVADLADTYGCPLARLLRKELRRRDFSGHVRAVFSPELPVRVKDTEKIAALPENPGEARPLGTIVYMPAIFGLRCAAEAVQQILASDKVPRL